MREVSERESKLPPEPIAHICSNCKYCHGVEGYDQQWGMFYRCHCWCDKDRNRMDTWDKTKEGHWMSSNPCELFEEGKGQYDEIPAKEKERYPH